MIKICKELYEFIVANLGLDFLKKLLLLKNKQNQNSHLALLSNKHYGGVEQSMKVLEILFEVVGKDEEFFLALTKQDSEMPNQIYNFLERNLAIITKRTKMQSNENLKKQKLDY
jgi:hypothetical protein